MKRFLYITNFFILLSGSGHASSFERYIGVLRHEASAQEQLAKLDLILTRSTQDKAELSAVLTLHFGDYSSGEYVAYHFHKVERFFIDQTLTFDEPDQSVTLRRAKLVGDSFEGDFRSDFSGNVGKLILQKEQDGFGVHPSLPLIQSIWGEYRGKCDPFQYGARQTVVQLYTYRSPLETTHVADPFGSYAVRGYLAQDTGDTCFGDEGSRLCLRSYFYSAKYNFFKSRLELFGKNQNLLCQTTPTGLECGGCHLSRVSAETTQGDSFRPPYSAAEFSEGVALPAPSLDSIDGEYEGYLHHEYLNAYQPLTISLLTYPTLDESQTVKMSANATLHFGERNGLESIAYRFDPRPFPNPLIGGNFIFKRPGQEVDAFIQVARFGKGRVEGVWYSRLFGRVGKFLVTKSGDVSVPENARNIPSLGGHYYGRFRTLTLAVGSKATPFNSENPFYPLSLAGNTILTNLGSARTVTGGSYDFYTGKIGIEIEDGKVSMMGLRGLDRTLQLRDTFKPLITSLAPHEAEHFKPFAREER